MLNKIDMDRISAAIAAAEDKTAGEIVCLLSQEVSRYREVPLAWAAAMAFAVPPLALAIGLHPLALAEQFGVWTVAQAGALENQFNLGLGLYAAAQAVVFVAVYLIVHIPAVRRALTPNSLKAHRVARAAHLQYAAFAARAEGSASGVLIYIALDDRQVQVLAEPALHSKADEAVWKQAVDAVGAAMKAGHDPTSGIVKAIEICGGALAAHFPADGAHHQAFAAKPVEL